MRESREGQHLPRSLGVQRHGQDWAAEGSTIDFNSESRFWPHFAPNDCPFGEDQTRGPLGLLLQLAAGIIARLDRGLSNQPSAN